MDRNGTLTKCLLEKHNSMVRNEVQRFNALVVKNTGDGFLPTYDGPRRATRCVWEIVEAAKELGIEVRLGFMLESASRSKRRQRDRNSHGFTGGRRGDSGGSLGLG